MDRIGDLLRRYLTERQRELAEPEGASVFSAWAQIVGCSLADHSRVSECEHNALYVEVDHPGWSQMLSLKKREILAQLRKRYPQLRIRDLRVRVSTAFAAERLQVQNETTAPAPEETRDQRIEETLQGVEEGELKESLRRLFNEARRRGEEGRGD